MKHFSWTKVLKTLKKFKKETDELDADRARQMYPDPKMFTELFSYRKGNQLIPFTTPIAIAHQLRKIEGAPRFWDYADEEGLEVEDEDEVEEENDE